jgi:hypothetical protein
VSGLRRRLLIALGAGVALVGLAALLVRISELTDFYVVCFWLGAVTVGLAVVALYSLAQSPTRLPRRPSHDPHCQESYSAPVVGVSDTERRNTGWASVYLLVAAVPCLLTAAVHYVTG